MARKLRTVKRGDIGKINAAIGALRTARRYLREAGAKRSAAYVARALKSAEGAERHARRARPLP